MQLAFFKNETKCTGCDNKAANGVEQSFPFQCGLMLNT